MTVEQTGCISLVTTGFGLAPFMPTILWTLQVISLCVGIPVGLITIYAFLDKKNLLPKWLQIKDKDTKEKP
jgi:hypothetical protein